jgi:hypothetical protein
VGDTSVVVAVVAGEPVLVVRDGWAGPNVSPGRSGMLIRVVPLAPGPKS